MTTTDEINRLQGILQARWPLAFPADPRACRPLKVGIREDIITALGLEFSPRIIHVALAKYTGRRGYLRALATGGPRIDLTGQAAGEVSTEQAAYAAERLKRLAERARQHQAAATEHAAPRTPATPCQDIPPAPARVPSRPILRLKKAGT